MWADSYGIHAFQCMFHQRRNNHHNYTTLYFAISKDERRVCYLTWIPILFYGNGRIRIGMLVPRAIY